MRGIDGLDGERGREPTVTRFDACRAELVEPAELPAPVSALRSDEPLEVARA